MGEQIGIPNAIVQHTDNKDLHYYKCLGDPAPVSRYPAFHNPGQLAVYTLVANNLICIPIITSRTIKLLTWGFRVTTLQADTGIKCAIYSNAKGTLYPTTLLQTLEEIACTSTGWKVSSNVNLILRRNILLWLAIWMKGGGSGQVITLSNSLDLNITGYEAVPAANEQASHGYYCSLIYTGIFPDPFPSWGGSPTVGKVNSQFDYPAILMRFTNP